MLRVYVAVCILAIGLFFFTKHSLGQDDSMSPQQIRALTVSPLDEFLTAWKKGKAEERSLFSVEELNLIFSFLRSEIASDYSISYRFQLNGSELIEERRFARSFGRILSTRKPIAGGIEEIRKSFDGAIVRHCAITGSKASASKSNTFDYAAMLDIDGDVLIRSMLMDLVETFNAKLASDDILAFLNNVPEGIWIGGKLKDIGGRMCFHVSQPLEDIWVCPELNYAICRICRYEAEEDGKVVEMQLIDFSDFREVKPGIYVPFHMDVFDSSRSRSVVVKVSEYIPDYEFKTNEVESIFPKNAVVRDQINDSVSLAHRESSVEEMLDFSMSKLKGLKSVSKPRGEKRDRNPLEYKQACGPVSSYVAINWLAPGKFSLSDVADQLGWSEGEKIPFASVFNYLDRQEGFQSKLVRITPEQLATILAEGEIAAVLPVSKSSSGIDHSVCVVAGDERNVMLIDYPDLAKPMSLSDLSQIWNGEAIIMSKLDTKNATGLLKASVLAAIIATVVGAFFLIRNQGDSVVD